MGIKDDCKTEDKNKDITKMNRRIFVGLAGTTAAAALAFGAAAPGSALPSIPGPILQAHAALNLRKYVDALVIPPVLTPDTTMYPGTDYYEMSIVQGTTHKFHRDLPATKTYSYFDSAPATGFHYLGPTIVATKGRPVKVKFTNNLPTGPHLLHRAIDPTIMGSLDGVNADGSPWVDENRVSVHMHGAKVNDEFDGGPRAWFSPVGSASSQQNPYAEAVSTTGSYIYEYPNDQPATFLWYHDHAWAITRFNPFAGLAAAYLLRDDGENNLISSGAIPSGGYEVPIVLQDKILDTLTGEMIYPVGNYPPGTTHPLWIPEYFGDTPVINGKAYPYLDVEPRRYRFRFLNGSNARFFNIWFDAGSGPIPFHVIGSEQGFLPAPAQVNKLLLAPGERFDAIVDFTGLAVGTTLLMKNNAKAPYPGGRGGLGQIMQFTVKALVGTDDTTPANSLTLPPSLESISPPAKSTTTWREIVLQEVMDPVSGAPKEALLDGYHFMDSVMDDSLFSEPAGAIRVWQFINTTGDAHPMHPHLAPFKILDRQPFDVAGFTAAWNAWLAAGRIGTRPTVDNFLTKGPAYGPAPEETGWKDTAKSYPGEVLRIVTRFDLPTDASSGTHRYVCHCHILEHEENDMMFQFAVVKS